MEYRPAMDTVASIQPMQVRAYSKNFGKTSGGDKSEYQACVSHKDVSGLLFHISVMAARWQP